MFNQKTPYASFKKAVLCCLVAGSVVYGETQLTSLEPIFKEEENVVGKFLKESAYVTIGDYSESIGTLDFFMVGKKHHYWSHLGLLGHATAGAGAGYRYLKKGSYSYQDCFVGVYAYGRSRYNAEDGEPSLRYDGGGEFATTHWQYTLNGYRYHQKTPKEKTNDWGVSLRISSYYVWKKMGLLGRVNPFGYIGYRHIHSIEANSIVDNNNRSQKRHGLFNGGIGLMWEAPYIAFVVQPIWFEQQGLWPKWYWGVQLSGRNNRDANYASHRIQERPKDYRLYYHYPEASEASASAQEAGQSDENSEISDNNSVKSSTVSDKGHSS